jgi:L,D-transpeptidase YcbB
MQKIVVTAVATLLAGSPAWSETAAPVAPPLPAKQAASPTVPAKPATATPANPTHPAAPKATAPASTPEQRSAAALALSHEPTYDEGTA